MSGTDPNITLAIIALLNMLTAFFAWRTHVSQTESATKIATLEKNTNSIKDALVASTAKASYAEGAEAGRVAEVKAANSREVKS